MEKRIVEAAGFRLGSGEVKGSKTDVTHLTPHTLCVRDNQQLLLQLALCD